MTPPLAGRSSAILSRFPAFQRAPTPGKVLASIAAALGRDLDESGKPAPAARIIEHLDDGIARGGFVHRMAVTSHAWKAGKPDDGKGHVYLVENPLVDRSTDDLQRRHLETIRIRRGGFFDGT